MKLTVKHVLVATIFALSFAELVVAGPQEDYERAKVASLRGDYATALRLFLPLAEQGHAGAQFSLGETYLHGFGVPKDDAEALKWYQLAADQGHAWAQHSLGLMYATGSRHVPQDYVSALMWLNLSTEDTSLVAFMVPVRDMIARVMTPAQIAEAQRLAREWKSRKPPRQ